MPDLVVDIIPYQELSGNYNQEDVKPPPTPIIPYQELSGNYNIDDGYVMLAQIIPYQELSGYYNCGIGTFQLPSDYTIPRTVREL